MRHRNRDRLLIPCLTNGPRVDRVHNLLNKELRLTWIGKGYKPKRVDVAADVRLRVPGKQKGRVLIRPFRHTLRELKFLSSPAKDYHQHGNRITDPSQAASHQYWGHAVTPETTAGAGRSMSGVGLIRKRRRAPLAAALQSGGSREASILGCQIGAVRVRSRATRLNCHNYNYENHLAKAKGVGDGSRG
jgi:hypothetical protein